MALGAFLGGLAQGGVNTYKMLEDIESQKKRDQLLELQAQEMREKADERAQLRTARLDTLGRVGQENYSGDLTKDAAIGQEQAQGLQVNSGDAAFDAAVARSDAATLRGNAKAQGAAIPELGKYTEQQANQDYTRRLRAIDPEKAQQYEASGYALKNAKRESDFNDEYDKLRDDWNKKTGALMATFDSTFATDGPNGVIKKMGPQFKQITGQDVNLVGNNVVVGSGKDATKIPVTQFREAFEGAMAQHYTSGFADELVKRGMFKNPNEAVQYMLKQRELSIKDREAGIHEGFYGKGGVYERTHMAAVNNNRRQTAAEIMNDRIEAGANAFMKGNPGMTREEAIRRSAQLATRDPEARNTVVTAADVNSFIQNNMDAVVEVDRATGKKITLADLPADRRVAIARQALGGAPTQQGGGMPDLGKDGLGEPPKPGAGPKQAVPEPETKYIRSQNNRGAYVYTPSPRGMTRAQWEELDAKKSALPQ